MTDALADFLAYTDQHVVEAKLDRIVDDLVNPNAVERPDIPAIKKSMRLFLRDNSDKSPAELKEIAESLSLPGSWHRAGGLVVAVLDGIIWPDPHLMTACIYHYWKGGKIGFQFLPDVRATNAETYETMAAELIALFWDSDIDPRRLLTNSDEEPDLDFYESLPERFTIYRGGNGISSDLLGMGLCWTTRRPIAEWFANRGDGEPVLLSATVRKQNVALAMASEHEIVSRCRRWRQLRCHRRKPHTRPAMTWSAQGPVSTRYG